MLGGSSWKPCGARFVRDLDEQVLEIHWLERSSSGHGRIGPGSVVGACQHYRHAAVASAMTRDFAGKMLAKVRRDLAGQNQACVCLLEIVYRRIQKQLPMMQEAHVGGDALQVRYDMRRKQHSHSRLAGARCNLT